jgi:hypothetical protein
MIYLDEEGLRLEDDKLVDPTAKALLCLRVTDDRLCLTFAEASKLLRALLRWKIMQPGGGGAVATMVAEGHAFMRSTRADLRRGEPKEPAR